MDFKRLLEPTCQIKTLGDIYNEYFGDLYEGFFVDVGAYDGVHWSNTSCLAEAGWHGIMIEPDEQIFMHLKDHKEKWGDKIICMRVAVGAAPGRCRLYKGSELPSTDIETVKSMNRSYNLDNYEVVIMMDLNSILELYGPDSLEVLSIDVEGGEYEVLQGFNIDQWQPKLIIIEMHQSNVLPAKKIHLSKLLQYFADHPEYKLIYSDDVNNIYVRN